MYGIESAKPILLDTDSIYAILYQQKKEMRKYIPVPHIYDKFFKLCENTNGEITGRKGYLYAGFYNENQVYYVDDTQVIDAIYYKSPYKIGDILYVKETFCYTNGGCEVIPKEWALRHEMDVENMSWKTAVHMKKNDSRIFLKIKNVRVERLQNMPHDAPLKEGIYFECCSCKYTWKAPVKGMFSGQIDSRFLYTTPMSAMSAMWNFGIKSDIAEKEWDANPWVFVYEFEVIHKNDLIQCSNESEKQI